MIEVPSTGTESQNWRRPRWIGLLWGAVFVIIVLLLLGGAALERAVSPLAPHPVVKVVLDELEVSTRSSLPLTLWIDPVARQVRVEVRGSRAVTYQEQDSSGRWYIMTQATRTDRWSRQSLPSSLAPALLSEEGIRDLFLRLREASPRRSREMTGILGRPAFAFTTTGLWWPYRYSATATVWVDAITGLPRQLRTRVPAAGVIETYITTIKSLTTVDSTSLPRGFLAPPDRRRSLWDRLMGR